MNAPAHTNRDAAIEGDQESTIGLGAQVAGRLRDAILSGQLRDGERVVERDIAATIGVSRGPVRDALRQLATEGLVVTEPRRGTTIASLTPDDGTEIMAIREAIEPLAARFLVQHASESSFEPLHHTLGRMRHACEHGDWAQAVVQDFALHRQLYLLCGRRRLLRMWESINAPLLHLFRMNRGLYDSIDEIYTNHAALVADIESGDPALAERAVREHITHFQPQLLALMCRTEGEHHDALE